MKRLLVVSPDAPWVESLQKGFKALDIEVVSVPGARSPERSIAALGSDPKSPFSGVLISALAAPGQSHSDALLEAADVLDALRKGGSSIPVLLWAPYSSERLSSIANRSPPTVMVTNDAPAALKATLAGASPDTVIPPRAAKVELQIGATDIRIEVALDGKPVGLPTIRDWSGRYKLKQLEDQFARWAPLKHDGSRPRYTDNWLDVLRVAGEDIFYEIDDTGKALTDAIRKCLNQVQTLDLIHFRFNLLTSAPDEPNPFVHVPFEMIYDANMENFVRALAPVARRVCVNSKSRTATALESTKPLIGHVLFVKSDAHGAYEFSGRGGARMFGPLRALGAEFDAVAQSRADAGRAPPEELALTVGGNALTQLQERLDAVLSGRTPALQIIHYAGHSMRADDDTTYLILPGAVSGEVLPLRMSQFAAWSRKAGVQLVILSSCESSGPEAVFRLSQAGIPAVIGFRWEVNDTEAAFFTGQVHKKLAAGVSLARAFHVAVSAVQGEYPDSPTFVSPMLVVQDDDWTTI